MIQNKRRQEGLLGNPAQVSFWQVLRYMMRSWEIHTRTCQIIQRCVWPDQVGEWYPVSHLYPVTVAVEVLPKRRHDKFSLVFTFKRKRCSCVPVSVTDHREDLKMSVCLHTDMYIKSERLLTGQAKGVSPESQNSLFRYAKHALLPTLLFQRGCLLS